MHEHMGHASLLTNTCTTVLGHRRVYMAYIYINSLFNMVFFFNSTFTKIIRKIFRLKVKKKKTDLSLPSFELQLKQGYQYMYIYICLPGIKDLVKIQYFSLMYHSQQPTWDTYNSGILSLNFAVLLFRISSRIPPLVGGREFLDFTMVKVLTFSWCLKYQKLKKTCRRKLAI